MRVLRWFGQGTLGRYLNPKRCRSVVKSPAGVRAVLRAQQADPTLARGAI
jgi:hypothetical protein